MPVPEKGEERSAKYVGGDTNCNDPNTAIKGQSNNGIIKGTILTSQVVTTKLDQESEDEGIMKLVRFASGENHLPARVSCPLYYRCRCSYCHCITNTLSQMRIFCPSCLENCYRPYRSTTRWVLPGIKICKSQDHVQALPSLGGSYGLGHSHSDSIIQVSQESHRSCVRFDPILV